MRKPAAKLVVPFWILLGIAVGAGIYLNRPFPVRMAAFVTDLGGRSQAQRENILRAGKPLQEQVIQSGEVFSLNEASGPFTEARGYLPERTYRGTETVDSPGGGVCQLASTLYNAARLGGFQILERVPHTRPVRSVPPGWDAAVAYGVSDLKFRNNYSYPVKLKSRIVGDQLLIEIWGKEKGHGSAQL